MKARRFITSKVRSKVAGALAVIAALASVSGVTAAVTSQASAASPRTTPPHTIKVGTQTLTQCKPSSTTYCATFAVPLDYTDPAGPKIKIAYVWYPATSAGPVTGTAVPVEGGPGYPSALSAKWYSIM
jgi:hypothetical protein